MTVSVVETQVKQGGFSAFALPFTEVPVAGDIAVVAFAGVGIGGTSITSVVGFGGTWVPFSVSSTNNGNVHFAIGWGFSTGGTVTVNLSTSDNGSVACYLVRGIPAGKLGYRTGLTTGASGTTLAGPALAAGPDMFCAAAIINNNTGLSAWPNTTSLPSQGDWTAALGTFQRNAACAPANAAGTYQVTAAYTGSTASRIGMVVVGYDPKAQVEGVYTEVLGVPESRARVEGVYTEVLGVPEGRAQVEAVYAESIFMGSTAQVEALYAESLVRGIGTAQVENVYLESLVVPAVPVYEKVGRAHADGLSPFATATSTWAPVLAGGGMDVFISAAAGDWLEIGTAILWDPGSVYTYMDIATLDALGQPVSWASGQPLGSHTNGVMGMFQNHGSNNYISASGSVYYQVKAGDIVGPGIRFRLYTKTNTGTHPINAANGPQLWVAPMSNPPVTATVSGTATTTAALLGTTITLAAVAGDVITAISNMVINPGAPAAVFDVATVVAGARVNHFSTGNATLGSGQGGWRTRFNDYEPIGGGGMLYTVQEADVVAGNVTLQVVGYVSGGTGPLDPGSTFSARKV